MEEGQYHATSDVSDSLCADSVMLATRSVLHSRMCSSQIVRQGKNLAALAKMSPSKDGKTKATPAPAGQRATIAGSQDASPDRRDALSSPRKEQGGRASKSKGQKAGGEGRVLLFVVCSGENS